MNSDEIEARKYLGVQVKYAHCLNTILPQASEKIEYASYIPLWDQVQYGFSLNNDAQRFYINKPTNSNRVFIPAKALAIASIDDPKCWKWVLLEEWGKELEIAELIAVTKFDVRGSVKTPLLSPNVLYLVAFVVMLARNNSGWDVPVTVQMKKPDGSIVETKQILQGNPIGEYFEVNAGELTLDDHGCKGNGVIEFALYQHDSQVKTKIVVKGVVIRSKASDGCPHA